MSRQLKGLLYFQTANGKHPFMIFWSILLGSNLIALLIAALAMASHDRMSVIYSAAAYIFAMFIGFLRVKQDVRYSLKLGATRKNIFVSTGIFFLGFSIINAILINGLEKLITSLTSLFHIHSFKPLHPALLLEDTLLNRFIIDISTMFFLLSLLFLFGLLFYRYGLVGGGSVSAAVVIAYLVSLGTGWLQDTVRSIAGTFSIDFFLYIMMIGIGLYFISWFFLRRITIIMKQ